MKLNREFKVEVKTAVLLTFMGVGAVASGIGCLTGAVRSIEEIGSGKIKVWKDELTIQEVNDAN